MIWEDYLLQMADWLGVTATQAGMMMSLIMTCCLIVTILIATRGHRAEITIPTGSLFACIFFTFLGWYPLWVGSVLSLVLAIFTGKVISDGVG